jgi:hypothetical protein
MMKNRLYLLNKNLIPAYAYFVITIFAFLFSRFYTIFTFGEYSQMMSTMWMFLLISGVAVYVFAAIVFTLLNRQLRHICLAVYSSGVVTYTAGMFVRGILVILGHYTHLTRYYEIAGIALMVIGFVLMIVFSQPFSRELIRKWPRLVKRYIHKGVSPEAALFIMVKNGKITQEEADTLKLAHSASEND